MLFKKINSLTGLLACIYVFQSLYNTLKCNVVCIFMCIEYNHRYIIETSVYYNIVKSNT